MIIGAVVDVHGHGHGNFRILWCYAGSIHFYTGFIHIYTHYIYYMVLGIKYIYTNLMRSYNRDTPGFKGIIRNVYHLQFYQDSYTNF